MFIKFPTCFMKDEEPFAIHSRINGKAELIVPSFMRLLSLQELQDLKASILADGSNYWLENRFGHDNISKCIFGTTKMF